jgi:hypothetical protein
MNEFKPNKRRRRRLLRRAMYARRRQRQIFPQFNRHSKNVGSGRRFGTSAAFLSLSASLIHVHMQMLLSIERTDL